MENVVYFFIPKTKEQNVSEDFKKLLSWLSTQQITLTPVSETKYKIEYAERPHVAYIEQTLPKDQVFKSDAGKITVSVSRADSFTIYNLKNFARDLGYRIFNLELNSFIPESNFMRDMTSLSLEPKIQKVFALYNLEPIFIAEFYKSNIFYARVKGRQEVYIVNPYLIEYHLAWSDFETKSKEFYYQVAPNIERFVQYANRGLIPYSFYSKYNQDIKIMNLSDIDIVNPQRKVFIKPMIFQVDDEGFSFFSKKGEKGSMILMDKIRPGETLDIAINRILSEWKLSDGYLRALVDTDIEFDKDRNNIITPRITVYVYVEKLLRQLEGSQRSWESIDPNS